MDVMGFLQPSKSSPYLRTFDGTEDYRTGQNRRDWPGPLRPLARVDVGNLGGSRVGGAGGAEEAYTTDAEKDGEGGFGYDEATGRFEGRKPQYIWKNTGWKVTEDHPVVNVSWNDAKAFCAWLSRKEKKTYRLPTEAEWEYACRAGSITAFHNGDDSEGLAQVGNVADGTAKAVLPTLKAITAKDGYVFTAPVGSFKKNGFGLFDLHGNVWEWFEDRYDAKGYENEPVRDPTGPATGSSRAFRGGSWDRAAGRCRSAARGGNSPTFRNFILGFRVILVP